MVYLLIFVMVVWLDLGIGGGLVGDGGKVFDVVSGCETPHFPLPSTPPTPPSSTSPSKSETRIGPTATMSNGASQSDKVVTFSVPVTKSDDRHKSLDSSNSPGDSDYESAQVHSTLNVGRFTDRM